MYSARFYLLSIKYAFRLTRRIENTGTLEIAIGPENAVALSCEYSSLRSLLSFHLCAHLVLSSFTPYASFCNLVSFHFQDFEDLF